MKAAIYEKYGAAKVLRLIEVPKPAPKANEILVNIHATTVTSADVRLRTSDFPALFWLPARLIFGLFRPKKKILGHEFAGVIEAVGEKVDKFSIGDNVFGTTTMLPTGAYANYVCIPQTWKHGVVSLMPENLGFAEAAALPIGAMTAMFLLEKAGIRAGQTALIYGASGSVGSYAVQLAKSQGAFVIAVCSDSNAEMVTALGADKTIDYCAEDYWRINELVDVVFDAVGKTNKVNAKKILSKHGRFVSVNMMTNEKDEHLQAIKKTTESGQLIPFIDRQYDLDDIVAAHLYVEKGHKRGNVVITLS